MVQDDNDLERLVHHRVVRLDAVVWGLTAGILGGLGLFIATNWLLLRGGDDVGKHLNLLGYYFIGYDVSFVGSLIGFVWAFVIAFAATWVLARVYNAIVDLRNRGGSTS